MKFYGVIVVFIVNVLGWKCVNSLSASGENVCSVQVSTTQTYYVQESYASPYTAYTCCGWFCLDRCRRTRYRTSYRSVAFQRTVYSTNYICCAGYRAPPGSNECTQPICDTECIHGTCTGPNFCSCDVGYHGPTCEYNCTTDIDNCETVHCTSTTDVFCTRCIYHVDDEIKAYQLVDGECHKICSWRQDSNTCYPGSCGNATDTCYCDVEFDDGHNCMNITVPPSVMNCSVSILGDGSFSINIPCHNETLSPVVYSNVAGKALSIIWETGFYGPSDEEQPIPPYVDDYSVGITSAGFFWVVARDDIYIDSGEIDCDLSISQDNPKHGLHSCVKYSKFSEHLQNGDSLFITAYSLNGGYLQIQNYDFSHTENVTDYLYYYDGKNVSMYLEVTIDLEPPTHCSVNVPRESSCVGNSLDIGDSYTQLNSIDIRWSPWIDYISGLATSSYDCRVYRMSAIDDVLYVQENIAILNYSKSEDGYQTTFQSHTMPGVYCVVLTVDDVAGNTRNTRRCLIFDNESEITIMADNPMYLTVDGVQLKNETDLTITGDEKIVLFWKDHFVNRLHVDEGLLSAINTDDDTFEEAYDSDANPRGRPLSAIDNRNGIVKFEFGISKYEIQPTVSEPVWKAVPNNLSENLFVNFDDTTEDSGIFEMRVRATDVIGNTKTDKILVHIKFKRSTSTVATAIGLSAGGLILLILMVVLILVFRRKTAKNKNTLIDSTPDFTYEDHHTEPHKQDKSDYNKLNDKNVDNEVFQEPDRHVYDNRMDQDGIYTEPKYKIDVSDDTNYQDPETIPVVNHVNQTASFNLAPKDQDATSASIVTDSGDGQEMYDAVMYLKDSYEDNIYLILDEGGSTVGTDEDQYMNM